MNRHQFLQVQFNRPYQWALCQKYGQRSKNCPSWYETFGVARPWLYSGAESSNKQNGCRDLGAQPPPRVGPVTRNPSVHTGYNPGYLTGYMGHVWVCMANNLLIDGLIAWPGLWKGLSSGAVILPMEMNLLTQNML